MGLSREGEVTELFGVGQAVTRLLDELGIDCDNQVAQELGDAGSESVRLALEHWTERLSEKCTSRDEQDVSKFRLRKLLVCACDVFVLPDELTATHLSQMERSGDENVTICITYFRRASDLMRCLASIPNGWPVLIQHTGSNVSWARNRLMQRCQTPYAMICEEDFEWFRPPRIVTDPGMLRAVLEHEPDIQFVGGRVCDDKTQWHHRMAIADDKLSMTAVVDPVHKTSSDVSYVRCDLVRQFGMLRTEFGRRFRWDEGLPTCEHTDYFLRMWKEGPGQCAYVDTCGVLHHNTRPNGSYLKARLRAWPLKKAVESLHGGLSIPDGVPPT